MATMLESALQYGEKGWHVFPCREGQSLPFEDENGTIRVMKQKSPYTKNGLLDASLGRIMIKSWWNQWPTAAIGVACEPSNLFVVDIDSKHGVNGFNNFMNLQVSDAGALHGLTPSGGLHVIYSGLGNSRTSKSTGLDVRSIGAYIIAPPSKIEYGGEILSYIMLDDWTRIPARIPSDLIRKLESYGNQSDESDRQKKPKRQPIVEPIEKTISKARGALNSLHPDYCDDYYMWIKVGLSLKSLGDAGKELWIEWSRKSPKFDLEVCEYKWEKFNPRDIGISSLFFWATKGGD